jgi:hypothetical protein
MILINYRDKKPKMRHVFWLKMGISFFEMLQIPDPILVQITFPSLTLKIILPGYYDSKKTF